MCRLVERRIAAWGRGKWDMRRLIFIRTSRSFTLITRGGSGSRAFTDDGAPQSAATTATAARSHKAGPVATGTKATARYKFKLNNILRIQTQRRTSNSKATRRSGGCGLNLGLNRRPIQSSLTRTLGKQAAATKAKSKAPIPQGGMATTSNPGLPDARGHLPGWIIRSRNLLGH